MFLPGLYTVRWSLVLAGYELRWKAAIVFFIHLTVLEVMSS